MENEGVKERLVAFLKYKKLSQGKFEKAIGASNAFVNNIRSSIQPDKLYKIAKLFPELNISWLMVGDLGVTNSTLTMATNGTRVPTWELLLDFCDAYPIDFRWIRTGEGAMIREDRETALLKRIAELEAEVARLRE